MLIWFSIYSRSNVLEAICRVNVGSRRHAPLLLVLFAFHFLDDGLPRRLMLLSHRLHERFDQVLRRLNPEYGENGSLRLDPYRFLIRARIYGYVNL